MRRKQFILDLPGIHQEELFQFHLDPKVLVELSPPAKKVRILERSDPMHAGGRVVLEARQFGFPIRWVSRIPVWEPPVRFIDVQEKGPFSYWRHEHRFEDGRLIDTIEYEVPLAWLGGSLVDRILISPDLEAMFSYRHEVTRKKLTRG